MVRNDTQTTSVFVNQKPIYGIKTCLPSHYAPVIISAQSDTASVSIEESFQ